MIKLNPIKPRKTIDPNKIAVAMENTLTAVAKDIEVDFHVTTQTWNNRPEFDIEEREGYRAIYTTNAIYGYLNYGTSIRYATMTPGFSPKTRRGFIGSNRGRGGLAYISRRHPRPGIQAREFDKAIARKWTQLLPRVMKRVIAASL